jgi:hypothetical protein
MSKNHPKKANVFNLPFQSIRHISSPEDLENERKIYVGQTLISSVMDLPTDENVRDYLLEAEGRQRRRPTQVNKAIRDTLENYSSNFSVLNSGIVIVARDSEIDEKNKILKLMEPSVINGAQTQGVIRDFLNNPDGSIDLQTVPVHVKFELIVTNDEDLIAEISIARNFQNDVMTISMAGRRGQLDELERSFKKKVPDGKLRKSETELSEDYVRTERLLQVIAALIPEEIWIDSREFNKVYTYSQRTRCLKDFQEIYKKANDKSDLDNIKYSNLYQFYLDIVAEADEIYWRWKKHQGFKGTGLRSIKRSDSSEIEDVPDGIIFPIIAALSAFAVKTKQGWIVKYPKLFNDAELIQTAKAAYMEIARSNPNKMGKTKACYSACYQITNIYKKLQSSIS